MVAPPAAHPDPRAVAVAGATGLVGRCLVQQLCARHDVTQVHALVRRSLDLQHPKLHQHVVDFSALPPLPQLDEIYLALGTTIALAGSQAAFRAVDFQANLAVAHAARAAGARRVGLVSAMGANPRSLIFYNRVKGELEEALAALDFDALVIARPSMLRGNRDALGQPARAGERRWTRVDAMLRPLIPPNLRAIDAADVAAALVGQLPRATGRQVLPSGAMQGAARPANA